MGANVQGSVLCSTCNKLRNLRGCALCLLCDVYLCLVTSRAQALTWGQSSRKDHGGGRGRVLASSVCTISYWYLNFVCDFILHIVTALFVIVQCAACVLTPACDSVQWYARSYCTRLLWYIHYTKMPAPTTMCQLDNHNVNLCHKYVFHLVTKLLSLMITIKFNLISEK